MSDITPLDKAVLDYRNDPSDENKAVLLDAQEKYLQGTFSTYADEYIRRTK